MLKNFLLVGLGGSLGSMIRYGMYIAFKGTHLPVATLLVNIVGSLLIGMLLGFGLRDAQFENNWKVFLSTGICGGFTTFSAFSLENMQMLQQGKFLLSALYISSSIVAGILAVWLGYKIATT